MSRLCALLIVGFLPLCSSQGWAEEPSAPTGAGDEEIVEALAGAGGNRKELERALRHFEASEEGDASQKLAATRFLIANMPGKGHVITVLKDEDGNEVSYDPTDYPNFKAALAALEALEKEHGSLDFSRDRLVEDLHTIQADYLTRHVDLAFTAWRRVPEEQRVPFEAFLEHILPYRGSEEPIDDWLDPLLRRYADLRRKLGDKGTPQGIYEWISKDVHKRFRFDERYYLHPTDQGFTEMGRSGLGRCEDISNMTTFAARSVGIATAVDFTPAWGHRDNNHAWNVLLGPDGRGFDKGNAHAAKVYRKKFGLQRGALPYLLPEGREAPNRFLASKTIVDVTDQYAPTTDVSVTLDAEVRGAERFAYLCVFNGGRWVAIHWGEVGEDHEVTFDRMGRNLLYLPAVHDGKALKPAGAPLIVHEDGRVEPLSGRGSQTSVVLAAVKPRQKSVDTLVETPISHLREGARYQLKLWEGGAWKDVESFTATKEAPSLQGLPSDGLYWLVAEESRRLERPWRIQGHRQRFR